MQYSPRYSSWIRWTSRVLATGVALLMVVAVVMVARNYLTDVEPRRVKVHEITLLKPPPPPPKPEEKPPDPPPVKKEEVKLPEPQPEEAPPPAQAQDAPVDEAPTGDALGVDGVGQGSGDSFGLVGNPGGRSLIGGGESRVGAQTRQTYRAYAGRLEREIYAALERLTEKDRQLRDASYKVAVKLWVGENGSIERFTLGDSTGNRALDDALKQALRELMTVHQRPPEGMPQPVHIRISSIQ